MRIVRIAAAALASVTIFIAGVALFPATAFASPLSLGPLSVTSWTVHHPGFDGTIAISGGTAPYLLAHQTGLPPGLTATVSGSAVSFTGTPTVVGTFSSGSVTVKDSTDATDTATFSIVVNSALSLGPLSVTSWTVNSPGFDGTIAISGGTAPYFLSDQTGLPPGLTASASSGTVSFTGTPTVEGTFSSGSEPMTDDTGATDTAIFSIVVESASPGWSPPAVVDNFLARS